MVFSVFMLYNLLILVEKEKRILIVDCFVLFFVIKQVFNMYTSNQ